MTGPDRSPGAASADTRSGTRADAEDAATPVEGATRNATEGELAPAVQELVASVERLLEKTDGADAVSVKRDLDRVRRLLGAPSGETARRADPEKGSRSAVPAARPAGSDEDIQKDLQRAML